MTEVFSDYLDQQKARIGQVIDTSLGQFKAEDWEIVVMMGQDRYKSLFDEHWDIITDYPSRRGKYLRPALVMLMAEAMSGSSEKAVYTATAMQMSEDWILIHDDWEDGSLERRGKPALHHIVSSEISVNAGDTLHECMHRVLSENYRLLDVSLARRVQHEFFLMLGRTTFGQYAEIKWTQDNKQDRASKPPQRKTAAAICFQIRDDVLDLTGDFEGQKRQSLNDIYEGKRTLILLHLLRHCTDDEHQRIEAILGKPREQKTAEEVQYIRDLMDTYGSIRFAASRAEAYARDALDRLSTIDFIQDSYRPLFRGMVDFILRRGR